MHHVEYWGRDQGRTDLANLRPMCRRHHALVHRDGWRLVLEAADGDVIAISPTGRRVTAGGPLTDEAVDADALVARLDELGIDGSTDDRDGWSSIAGRWGGERMTSWARAEIGSAIADACTVPELLGDDHELVPAGAASGRGDPPSAR